MIAPGLYINLQRTINMKLNILIVLFLSVLGFVKAAKYCPLHECLYPRIEHALPYPNAVEYYQCTANADVMKSCIKDKLDNHNLCDCISRNQTIVVSHFYGLYEATYHEYPYECYFLDPDCKDAEIRRCKAKEEHIWIQNVYYNNLGPAEEFVACLDKYRHKYGKCFLNKLKTRLNKQDQDKLLESTVEWYRYLIRGCNNLKPVVDCLRETKVHPIKDKCRIDDVMDAYKQCVKNKMAAQGQVCDGFGEVFDVVHDVGEKWPLDYQCQIKRKAEQKLAGCW
eukprot:GHVU01040293.1.p1 GENE.GHVU01040293.1~~GHVU01040293.1.p1  ORF type:complete len:281 (+),score=19.34 GHVU01040293.1:95-937(+)